MWYTPPEHQSLGKKKSIQSHFKHAAKKYFRWKPQQSTSREVVGQLTNIFKLWHYLLLRPNPMGPPHQTTEHHPLLERKICPNELPTWDTKPPSNCPWATFRSLSVMDEGSQTQTYSLDQPAPLYPPISLTLYPWAASPKECSSPFEQPPK